jgi:DNA-binding CsgD family transcriptional regulator
LRYSISEVSELALLLTRTPTAVLLADEERRCVDANSAACTFLRATRNHLLGGSIDNWLPADERESLRAAWAKLLQRGSVAGRIRLRVLAGAVASVDFTATAHVAPDRHLLILSPPAGAGETAATDFANGTAMSAREREVMELVAAGATTDQVAGRLVISQETVRRHVKNAMAKLDANTRAQAVAIALRRGELSV